MNYQDVVQFAIGDAKGSIGLFRPELVVCGTILLLLGLRVFDRLARIPTWLVALAGCGVALWLSVPWQSLAAGKLPEPVEIFTGMLVIDSLTLFFRFVLLLFAILFIVFTRISGIPDRHDAPDFYTLVLGATLGMLLMAEANHLLVIFLAVEMASVPSYVLAGMLKGRRRSSEAALKYSVYGAGAAGVMLYGISLLAGVLGSCHLPTMAQRLASMMDPTRAGVQGSIAAAGVSDPNWVVLVLGGLMLAVGLAFKLSAVPFHFWCPDVFEGASAEINAFLSVASKAAALALLIRVVVGFGTVPSHVVEKKIGDKTELVQVAGREEVHSRPVTLKKPRLSVAEAIDNWQIENAEFDRVDIEQSQSQGSNIEMQGPDANTSLTRVRQFMLYLVVLISAITCTFGNLAAYGQTNIKRLLAYSTIAHAGYMMMPVAAALALMNSGQPGVAKAFASLLFYVFIYMFMNLGAFAVVAFVRNITWSEEISDYAGLIRTAPGVAICFCIILFSLIGIPPMIGFVGKLLIFESLVTAATAPTIALLIVGGVNSALALVYYLRVIKVMTIDAPSESRPPVELSLVSISGVFLVVITLPLLLMVLDWNSLTEWTVAACRQLWQ